jgi:hypothetical protein
VGVDVSFELGADFGGKLGSTQTIATAYLMREIEY